MSDPKVSVELSQRLGTKPETIRERYISYYGLFHLESLYSFIKKQQITICSPHFWYQYLVLQARTNCSIITFDYTKGYILLQYWSPIIKVTSFRCIFIHVRQFEILKVNHKASDQTELECLFVVCLLLSCIVLLLAHGRPDTLPLRVDVSCGDVRVTGGWNRLQEGVRTVCVPSAWTAVYFLLSGKTLYSFIVSPDIVFFFYYFTPIW